MLDLSSLRGAKRRSNPWWSHPSHGLLRGACHRAALCADPLARNDGLKKHRSRLLGFNAFRPYIVAMTRLLDEAVEAVRRLPSDDQDDIARAIMQLAGSDLAAPIALSPEERQAIARSKAAAGRGEFATDEQVRAVWAKHGL